ncbi:MAG: hypothetical protein KGI71_05930 [Patescibacteria group bacterium]|nr:hypothetical protein [Patescibacteria group bacterium]
MATVTFANGKTVTFNGTPTPDDIDYVAKQMGIQPDTPSSSAPTPVDSGATDTSNLDTYEPWTTTTTNPVTGKSMRTLNLGGDINNVGAFLYNNGFAGSQVGTGMAHAIQGALDKVQGTNYAQYIPQPTVLQMAADTANLGLMAATGGGSAAAEGGAEAAAPGLARTLASKLLPNGNTIKSGLALGGLSGGLQSVANGSTNSGDVLAHTGQGAILGGLTGGLIHGISGTAALGEANTGIDAAAANTLRKTPTSIFTKYANAALKTQTDQYAPTPTAIMDNMLEHDVTTKLEPAITQAGNKIGTILQQQGDTPLVDDVSGAPITQTLLQNFNNRLQQKFGYEIADEFPDAVYTGKAPQLAADDPLAADMNAYIKKYAGSVPAADTPPDLIQLDNRGRNLAPVEKARILAAWQNLKILATKPTLQMASDAAHNFDDAIDYSKAGDAIPKRDRLESFLKDTRFDVNNALRQTSPDLATANDTYSNLRDTENELAGAAGNNLSRASLLMRRVFSGDKSKEANNILDSLRLATGGTVMKDAAGNIIANPSDPTRPLIQGGTDYQTHAAMADLATALFAHSRAQTLFTQGVGKGLGVTGARALAGQKSGIAQWLFRNLEGVVTPDAMNYARSLTQGREGLIQRSAGSLADSIDELADKGLLSSALKPLATGLNQAGIHASHAPIGARQLLKMYLVGKMTTPQPSAQMPGRDLSGVY